MAMMHRTNYLSFVLTVVTGQFFHSAGLHSETVDAIDRSMQTCSAPRAEVATDMGVQFLQTQVRSVRNKSLAQRQTAALPRRLLEMVKLGNSSDLSKSSSASGHVMALEALGGGVVFAALAFTLWLWARTVTANDHKTTLYKMLSRHSHRPQAKVFRRLIATIVVVNLAALLVQTSPETGKHYAIEFQLIEGVSSWIFLVEYCMRVYVIPESKHYKNLTSSGARLRWMVTFESIIDVLSFLPWFIEAFGTIIMPTRKVELPTLTWLRVVRLFRLFKVPFISESMDIFARVIYYNSEILIVAGILCSVLVLILSVLLYMMAPQDVNSHAEDYSSITACMYLAVMMLTGQGQPDGVLPWYTKIVVCITCVFAVGLFAIQASMLTWGFENEADRRIKKNKKEKDDKVKAIMAGEDGSISSSSSEDDPDSDWEDYEENIAGSDSDSEEEVYDENLPAYCEELDRMRDSFLPQHRECLIKVFKHLSVSADGQLDKEELTNIPGFNAEVFLNRLDKEDDSTSISFTEFVGWVRTVKETQTSEIFKLFLKDLVKACKASKERKRKLQAEEKYEPQVQHIERFAQSFRSLKSENEQLNLENKRLKKEVQQLQAQQPRRSKRGSVLDHLR